MINSLMISSQYSVGTFPYYLKLKSLTHWLNPFIAFEIANTNYVVKTATTAGELSEVLKLRFNVFHQEFSGKKPHLSLIRYDIDSFDFKCDHLIVKEKASGKVVATYRLLAETQDRKIERFYSQNEFHMEEFLKLEGNKVELGRACVHKDFRNGEVISMLWKGLCTYAKRADAKYLFGCSSITSDQLPYLSSIIQQLEKKEALIADANICATQDFSLSRMPYHEQSTEKANLSSLINMYLLAGAKMYSGLAYDADMRCVDLLTVMNMETMPASFIRRFAC